MNRKLKASARSVALDVLIDVERKNAFSHLELNAALNKTSLSRKETGLATELVYGSLSRLNTLDWMAAKAAKRPVDKLDPWVRNLLRLTLYQLHYLDRIPARAAVHEAVEIAKERGNQGAAGFVNGALRGYLRAKETMRPPGQWPKFKKIALEHSHPEWLVKRWLSVYGERDTIDMCAANNSPPPLSVRVNGLRASKEDFIKRLAEEAPEAETVPSPLIENGLRVSNVGNIAELPLFREGLCSIQDESSMLVSLAMAVEPGMSVLDACAAPGGKTSHLAELMDNRGNIVALDIHPRKLRLIRENTDRLGISIVQNRQADARRLPTELKNASFDRVLVDAPCSGFGVIRRKPDLKWKKRERDIASLAEVQREILQQAASCLKRGGKLVYSTCTVDPEENWRLAHRFLDENPDFELDVSFVDDMPAALRDRFHQSGGYLQILPHYFESDGFFISRFVKR